MKPSANWSQQKGRPIQTYPLQPPPPYPWPGIVWRLLVKERIDYIAKRRNFFHWIGLISVVSAMFVCGCVDMCNVLFESLFIGVGWIFLVIEVHPWNAHIRNDFIHFGMYRIEREKKLHQTTCSRSIETDLVSFTSECYMVCETWNNLVDGGDFFVLLLQPAHVERCSVSHTQDPLGRVGL